MTPRPLEVASPCDPAIAPSPARFLALVVELCLPRLAHLNY